MSFHRIIPLRSTDHREPEFEPVILFYVHNQGRLWRDASRRGLMSIAKGRRIVDIAEPDNMGLAEMEGLAWDEEF